MTKNKKLTLRRVHSSCKELWNVEKKKKEKKTTGKDKRQKDLSSMTEVAVVNNYIYNKEKRLGLYTTILVPHRIGF